MENLIQQLIFGFGVTLQPMNLLCAFLGVLMGTLVGVLPGLGPVGTMAILLPITYGIPPTGRHHHAPAGIYYGAIWRLHHLHPGEHPGRSRLGRDLPGRVPDGPQGPGRPGPGNCRPSAPLSPGTWVIVALASWPRRWCAALTFGPPEYFSLVMPRDDVLTFLAQVDAEGPDDGDLGLSRDRRPGITTGNHRFTFRLPELLEGLASPPWPWGSSESPRSSATRKEDAGLEIETKLMASSQPAGLERASAPSCAEPSSGFSSASCPAGARSCPPFRPMRWRSASPSARNGSAPGHRRGCRARVGEQRGARGASSP